MILISSSYIRDPLDGTLSPALVLELQGMILEQVKMHMLKSFTEPKGTMHHKTQGMAEPVVPGATQRTGGPPSHLPAQSPAKTNALSGVHPAGTRGSRGPLQGDPPAGGIRRRTKAEVSVCCMLIVADWDGEG